MQRESFNSGIEYLLKSDRGEEIMVYCLLPEYGVIGKIKWYSEVDSEMCGYLIKAFVQKYLRKQFFIKLK